MPSVDAVLLPLVIGLTLLGLIVTGLAWRRGRRGRVLQGLALALAPVALYLTGLLRLLWDGGVALVRWAGSVVLSPTMWLGFGVLALCLVLWVVGGLVARRAPRRDRGKRARTAAPAGTGAAAALPATRPGAGGRPAAQQPAADDDFSDIEALLKARGIE